MNTRRALFLSALIVITGIILYANVSGWPETDRYGSVPFLAGHEGTEAYEIKLISFPNSGVDDMYYDSVADQLVLWTGRYWKFTREGEFIDTLKQGMIDTFPDGTIWSALGYSNWVTNSDPSLKDVYSYHIVDTLKKRLRTDVDSIINRHSLAIHIYDSLYTQSTAVSYYGGANFKIGEEWFTITGYTDTLNNYLSKVGYSSDNRKYHKKVTQKRLTRIHADGTWKDDKAGLEVVDYGVTDTFSRWEFGRTTFTHGVYVLDLPMPGDTLRFKYIGDGIEPLVRSYRVPARFGGTDSVVFLSGVVGPGYPADAATGIYVVRPRRE